MTRTLAGLLALALLSGCYDELYHGLEERAANEMIVALEQSGVDADKVRDPEDSERWVVRVPGGAHTEAIHALEVRGLPRPEIQGFDNFYPSEGLVPTASEERILLQFATSQELRRSLMAVDGVVDAHVNLVLPENSRFKSRPQTPARASVVVRYEAQGKPPIGAADVKRIVAGGVDGLDPESVEVLLTPSRAATKPLTEPRLAQVGPISVPSGNRAFAQAVFGGLTMLVLGLAGALVLLVLRRRGEG